MRDEKKVLAKAVQALNRHLPTQRRPLSDLLLEEKPRVGLKDGSTHRFRREELERIASIIPQRKHHLVRLPIYLEMASEYGRGAAKIRGYIDISIVQDILEMEQEEKDEIILYSLDVRRLRRELPTTTQYAFFISL